MSSSGLIYAVIVGAWAAYLVPMWLRRQDELNEARPTERFSTAIRLLAGRTAMERRASRAIGNDDSDSNSESNTPSAEPGESGPEDSASSGDPAAPRASAAPPASTADPDAVPLQRPNPAATDRGPTADRGPAREPSYSRTSARAERAEPDDAAANPQAPAGRAPGPRGGSRGARGSRAQRAGDEARAGAERRRAKLLARRRRMVTLLFFAFALGAIIAAVGGFGWLWAPMLPALLLSLYIGHLRRQERRRYEAKYEVKLDRGRAAEAAQRLHERERTRDARRAEAAAASAEPSRRTGGTAQNTAARPERPAEPVRRGPAQSYDAVHPGDRAHRPDLRIAADPTTAPHAAPGAAPHAGAPVAAQSRQAGPPALPESAAGQQALVEATDHEEWVDGLRDRSPAGPDSWEPVPVPLPTYVTAPVAQRGTGSLERHAQDAGWNPGRGPAAAPVAPAPSASAAALAANNQLFDQYAEPGRPTDQGRQPGAADDQDYHLERRRAANE